MTKLKPCPFCGCKARFYEESKEGYDPTSGVECPGCGIRKGGYYSKIDAIIAWNDRVKI